MTDDSERLQMQFDDNSLLPQLYGERDRHLDRIERELGVSVTSRGNRLAIAGPHANADVARNALAKPDDNFNPPSDGAGMFLGRVNRVYGAMRTNLPDGRYHGVVGYIYK